MSYQDKDKQMGRIMQTRLHVPTEKEKYGHTLHIPRTKSRINTLKKTHLTHKTALFKINTCYIYIHICHKKNSQGKKVLKWKLIADTETKKILARQDDRVGIDMMQMWVC